MGDSYHSSLPFAAASARRRGGTATAILSSTVPIASTSSSSSSTKGLRIAATSSRPLQQQQQYRTRITACFVCVGVALCLVWVVVILMSTHSSSSSTFQYIKRQENRIRVGGGIGKSGGAVGLPLSTDKVEGLQNQRNIRQNEQEALPRRPALATGKSSWVQALIRWTTADAPPSTDDENKLHALQVTLQTKHGPPNGRVESCRWLSTRSESDNIRIQSLCSASTTTATRPLILYNALSTHERLLHVSSDAVLTIAPNESIVVHVETLETLSSQCRGTTATALDCIVANSPVSLFPDVPQPDNAANFAPIVLRYGDEMEGGSKNTPLFPGCNVPCQSEGKPAILGIREVVVIDGITKWQFTYSMEGEGYYETVKINNPLAWKDNKFWSTTSYQSEVPLPYYSKAEYKIQNGHPPVNYDKAIHGAVFLARNCDSVNHREERVKQLQESASRFRTDSLSSCLHNADPPPGLDMGNKIAVMQRYLFYLAFENQCVDDYITEKLWGPMEAGTVPIYYGAPNVMEHVPNNSIIHVGDYATTADLVDHLVRVANNKTLYESYHAWRKQPLPLHFQVKYNLTDTHSTCRMCRWAYARMYGVGWNHTMQELQPLKTGSRNLCLHTTSSTSGSLSVVKSFEYLIRHPFNEVWSEPVILSTGPALVKQALKEEDACRLDNDNRAVLVDNGRIRRTVRYQDGVVDLLLERMNENDSAKVVTLQLHTPVANSTLSKVQDGIWRIQDARVRFTILSLPVTLDSIIAPSSGSVGGGVVQISILPTFLSVLRLRIIVEDIDTFHKDADKEENFFGKLMTADFFNPLEVFVQVE